MPTLAINTSANFVSLALLDGENVVSELDSRSDFQLTGSKAGNATSLASGGPAGSNDQLPPGYTKKRSKRGQATRRVFPPGASVMLAPMLQSMFKQQQIQTSDLDLICLCNGPGMFTGLRVGVVTAKSLAYAGKADLVAVGALDAIAAQTFSALPEAAGINLHVAINAQRQQLFAAQFRHLGPWRVEKHVPDRIVDQSQFVAGLKSGDFVVGTGLKPLIETLAAEPDVTATAPETWELTASSVGQVGTAMYAAGHRDDYLKVEPLYFRPSAAEEMRLQRALNKPEN